jgi:hypothetical protein
MIHTQQSLCTHWHNLLKCFVLFQLLVQAKAALAAALKDRYMPSFVGARFSFPDAPDA